ncbi:LPXTG cell wall anchor domain-containing protein [Candidatus Collinsella stercoripullorum]
MRGARNRPPAPACGRGGLPKTGDASAPAVIAAGVGSLLCLVAVPRLRRR